MSAALQAISMKNTLGLSESHSKVSSSVANGRQCSHDDVSIKKQPFIFWVSNSLRLERKEEWRDELREEKSHQSWWNLRWEVMEK